MRILRLRASNFRNIEFADLSFDGAQRVFFVGKNGQGKTNLLETASLLTALRSFRTRDARLLVRHGQKVAQVFLALEHEREGATELAFEISSSGGKTVETGAGTPVRRLSEFVGRFPVVVFSSDDVGLLRGAPARRRRWLDLTLSTLSADYFFHLQRYHRALDARNRLLKSPAPLQQTEAQFDAFEKILAASGCKIAETRSREMQKISSVFSSCATAIACADEGAALAYEPSVAPPAGTPSAENDAGGATEKKSAAEAAEATWREVFRRSREQDKFLRATQKGPHRDDFSFRLFGRVAADFASEGQQRGLALSLGLAQIAVFRERLGVSPVVLADDVLGELDAERKAGFWNAVGGEIQVFATGTLPPVVAQGGGNDGDDVPAWKIYSVENGKYLACGGA